MTPETNHDVEISIYHDFLEDQGIIVDRTPEEQDQWVYESKYYSVFVFGVGVFVGGVGGRVGVVVGGVGGRVGVVVGAGGAVAGDGGDGVGAGGFGVGVGAGGVGISRSVGG